MRETIEMIVIVGALAVGIQVYTPIDVSMEGLAAMLYGWWMLGRGLIRPPVSIELVPPSA